MDAYKICFHGEIKKNNYVENPSYLELCLQECVFSIYPTVTVFILPIQTYKPEQTMQTQIRSQRIESMPI